jgi:hypothetical protein
LLGCGSSRHGGLLQWKYSLQTFHSAAFNSQGSAAFLAAATLGILISS